MSKNLLKKYEDVFIKSFSIEKKKIKKFEI